jgi:hypothetical protein
MEHTHRVFSEADHHNWLCMSGQALLDHGPSDLDFFVQTHGASL